MAKLTFIDRMIARQPKPKSPVPSMKKITKAVEAMGKHVSAYEMRSDGAVKVFVSHEAKPDAKANPWDKVLNNGAS